MMFSKSHFPVLICAGDSSIVCFYSNCSIKITINITRVITIITIVTITNGCDNDIEMAVLFSAFFCVG